MGKSKGPFGGSSHCSASAEAVWAVWTNPGAWSGGCHRDGQDRRSVRCGGEDHDAGQGLSAADIDR